MSDLRLRLAVPDDAGAIRDLTRAAYAKWIPVAGREPLPMGADYAEALKSHRFDLLDAPDGRLAGLIETVPDDDWLLIVNVAVAPEFQRQGHGLRLLAHAEALAADVGLTGVRLYTNRLFATNLRLYAALGYEVEREEALNGGVAVHMTKARKA